MGTWAQVGEEIRLELASGNVEAFDKVRRKYLNELHTLTGRNVILYASKFLQGDVSSAHSVSIVDEDLSGFMEVIHGLEGGKGLDLIMHSPGGSVEAAEGLVLYIRSKFTDVRVIVPQLAQSAATMIACAANCVMMGKHSFLGPTDPQIQIQTSYGVQFVPAQAITAQFDKAVKECLDPKKLAAWMPMLGQYGPHLLTMCENFTTLSRELVGEWLYKYMYEGDPTKKSQSKSLSDWLSNHEEFKTHSTGKLQKGNSVAAKSSANRI